MRRCATMALAAVLSVVAISACGSGSDNAGGSDQGGTPAASAAAPGKKLKFIFVGIQPTGEPSAAHLAAGAKAADAAFGTTTEYRSVQSKTLDPNEQRRILENALAQKPDGVLVVDTAPEQINPTIKKFTEAGIPVVLISGGLGQVEATGALTFIGNDETASGELGGRMLGEAGAKHALMITLQPGLAIADMRTAGFKKGFPGKVTTVELSIRDLFDSTKVRNVTEAELQKDKSIDAVFSVGDCCSPAILAARAQIGARGEAVHWATIDSGKPALNAIASGAMDFALEQQPWLQGFLGVQTLALYNRYGFKLGTDHLPTGPVAVDKSNIEQVVELTKDGVR